MIKRYSPSPSALKVMMFKPQDGKWCRYSQVMDEIDSLNTYHAGNLAQRDDTLHSLEAINGELSRKLDTYRSLYGDPDEST